MKQTFIAFITLCMLCVCKDMSYGRHTDVYGKHFTNVYEDDAIKKLPLDNLLMQSGSFHVFSHGRPGQLYLGGKWLNPSEIATFLAEKTLSSFQHINIYGCEFGKGEKGKAAVAYLQKTLGVSISASDDITGKDGDWQLEVGKPITITGLEEYSENLQYASTDDFDGDGVLNQDDIDDDNDGVPDAVESPTCYYKADDWNTGAKPTSAVTITSALTTTTSNFSQLTNGIDNVTAVTFTSAQAILNANVYLFTFAHPVVLDALYLKFNTATQFANTTKIQGSNTNNGSDWVDLSAAIAQTAGTNITVDGSVSVTTSIKYPVTLNATTAYKYIRITGAVASNIAAQNASEVYFDFDAASYVASLYPTATCTDTNVDGDGVLPQFDLDSDGDGCSDAYESGATTNNTANYQFPDVDANNDGLVDAVDTNNDGIVGYTSTYNLYAIYYAFASCKDSDGDGVLDLADLDDDNDGITDKAECPGLTSNLSTGGGFTVAGDAIANWYMGFTSTSLPITTSFTPTVIPVTNNGDVYNYGGQPTYSGNSTITGGLFDLVDGVNTATGVQYVLQENDPQRPVVYELQIPLVAGANYQFAFDLGARTNNPSATNKYVILLYNADTKTPEKVIAFDNLSTLPGPSSSPAYKTVTGVFTPNTSSNYYLLFYPTISGGAADDFTIDRAAVLGGTASICDTDGDGIPNHLDLDSDGDGCADAIEGGGSFAVGDLVNSSMPGGNSGGTYNGTSSSPVTQNLGNSVGNTPTTMGIPTAAATGQIVYVSQQKLLNECEDTDSDGVGDLADLDDDNDGILDAVESPSCFYTEAEAKALTSVTSELAPYLTNLPANTIDNNSATYGAFNGALNWVDKELYRVTSATPIAISSMELDLTIWALSSTAAMTFKLQGSQDGSTWVDLSGALASTASTGTFSITNSQPTIRYGYYRLIGVAGTSYYGGVTEIRLVPNNFIASAYQKSTCTSDTDGDGIPNYHDLDSDGDGCADAVEGGASFTASSLVASSIPGGNSGGSYNGTSASPVTQNLGNTVGNTSTTMGVPTVANTGQNVNFSQNKLFNECTDSDADGVNDLADLDDDNDGVPDAVEAPSCYYSATDMGVPTGITSEIPTTGTIANLYDNLTTPTFAFTATTAANAKQKTVFEITPAYPVAATSIVLHTNAATTSIFGALAANTAILKAQGWNGTAWVDLATYTAAPATAANLQTFSFTNSTVYSKYRLYDDGTTGVNITAGVLQEVGLGFPATYVASAYPKATCTTDTDGDGIINTLDLDSDGDGCSDAYEAGATSVKTSNYQFPDVDSNNDGLVDAVDAGEDGMTDYTSTYYYATNSLNNACSDYDGDGVSDLVDLDDDNDGILDTAEGCANSTASVYVYAYPSLSGGVSETAPIYTTGTSTSTPNRTEVDTYFYGQGVGVRKPSNTSYTLIEGAYSQDASINALNVFQNGEINFSNAGEASTANSGGYYIIEFLLKIPDNATTIGLRSNTPGAVVCNHALYVGYTGSSSAPTPSASKADVWPIGSGNSDNPSPEIVFTNAGGRYVRVTLTTNDGNANCGVVLQWSINGAAYANVPFSAAGQDDCTLDTDGDGIPNRLDLDSDGDGCPDAVEGGANFTTSSLVASSIPGGNSGGSYNGTSSTPVTQNLGNTVGNTSTTLGVPTVAGTGQTVSLSQNKFLNDCADTDGDGKNDLTDIDDDNDGILDAVEAPSCYYTATEMGVPTGITSEIPTTGTIANLYDNLTTPTFAFTATTAANAKQKAVFEITPAYPVAATSIVLHTNAATTSIFGTLAANTAILKAQGWNGTAWVDLATYTAAPATAANLQTFTFTNSTVYSKYRLYDDGTTGVNITAGVLQEVGLGFPGTYVASSYPKAACTTDTDGDGIINTLDLDSDGDGCPDALEGGTNNGSDLITTSNLVQSTIPGGNSGTGYTGSAGPVVTNLGTTIDANGVPTTANGGQILGSSQNASSQVAECTTPPVAVMDNISNPTPGSAVSSNITTNDTGGSTIVPSTVSLIVPGTGGTCEDTDSDGDCDKLTIPGEGVWTITSTGTLTFTPEPGFVTDPTDITYTVMNAGGLTTTPVTVTVDNPPVATADNGTGFYGQPAEVSILDNDTDGDTVDPTTVQIVGTANPGDPLEVPGEGTWTVNATNGVITFTPLSGFVSSPTPISYIVQDSEGNPSNAVQVSILYSLPVTLVNFKATESVEGVKLTWQTTEEKAFDRFDVEQSSNPLKGFAKIGEVKGGLSDYSYIDAVKRIGGSYYRLKMVDIDGSFKYSSIVNIQSRNGLELYKVYPNPTHGLRMHLASNGPIESFKIYDASGRAVSAQMTGSDGYYEFKFTKGIAPGIYVISYKTDGREFSQQFVLSN